MNGVLRLLMLVLLMAAVGLAQGEKCKTDNGYVRDKAGQPIGGVKITISSSLGTVSGSTDKQGIYNMTVACTETSKHTVTPSKPGYVFAPASRPWHKYSGAPSFTGRKTSEK